jgi:hypothetical protein
MFVEDTRAHAMSESLRWDIERREWVYTFRCDCGRRWAVTQGEFPFVCRCGATADIDRTGT